MAKKSNTKKSKKAYNATKIKKIMTKKRLTNLESFLQSVYHDNVNLETTCNHRKICCETAMPQMNYCEFVNIVTKIWEELKGKDNEKLLLITTSLEYFFRNEFKKWGKDSLIKPCMLLDQGTGLCKIYSSRPLNCRMYGLWPKDDYERRVSKFEKAYAQYGLKREDLPLNTQCPYVKRVDTEKEITTELIESLFAKLDKMDETVGNFSKLQVSQKENYRTFQDWLLLKVLGEDWLAKLTAFVLGADKKTMEDQMKTIIDVWSKEFLKNGLPDITERL